MTAKVLEVPSCEQIVTTPFMLALLYDPEVLENDLIKIRACLSSEKMLKREKPSDLLLLKGVSFPVKMLSKRQSSKYRMDREKTSLYWLYELYKWWSQHSGEISLKAEHATFQKFLIQSNYFKDDHYADLARALLFSLVKNTGAVQKNLKNFIALAPRRFTLYPVYKPALKDQEWIYEVVKKIIDTLDNDKLVNAFLMYLDFVVKDRQLSRKIHSLMSETSLKSIRRFYSSYNYGYRFPNAWFPTLFSRTSINESYAYLDKALSHGSLAESAWLLKYYLPRDEKIRDAILAYLSQGLEKNDIYVRETFYSLLSSEKLVTFFAKNNLLGKRKVFNEKRTLYLEMLEKGMGRDYSIYQLLKLGHIEQDLIWWVIYR